MRINEDFIDRIEDNDIEISSLSDSDIQTGSYGKHTLKFLFIITKDFSTLSTEDYIIEIDKFYNRLFKNFDSLGFIKGHDDIRNVNCVNLYYIGEKFSKTINNITFFNAKEDCVESCKQNSWFNFKLTFDAKTESVSDIVKLLFGLFVSLRNAAQYAFGKLTKKENLTLVYQKEKDDEHFEKYFAQGIAQLYSNDNSWKIIKAIRMCDLSKLENNKVEDKILDFYTAFHPANNDAELYESRIKVRKFLNSISSFQQ